MAEAPHRFRNNAVAVPLGNRGWDEAMAHGLLGIRAVSRAPTRWPARSLSVSTASLAPGQLKPWPIRPVVT